MCRVHNKHHATAPASAIFIGRPSKWGNPFQIGKHGDRATVIARYALWLARNDELFAALGELRGKDLICYCAPQACHGDLLLMLANSTIEERRAWRTRTLALAA